MCAKAARSSKRRLRFQRLGGRRSKRAFDFATPITKDIILVAVWEESDSNKPGSKNNPYLIGTADDLADFADRLNHIETEEDEQYAKSYFKLVADIDMDGMKYVSAGQLTTLNEGEENEKTIYGFSGNFDGNGHTISNLTITRNIRSGIVYVGMFGYCTRATITNLTLEDVCYSVVSGADKTTSAHTWAAWLRSATSRISPT